MWNRTRRPPVRMTASEMRSTLAGSTRRPATMALSQAPSRPRSQRFMSRTDSGTRTRAWA